MTTFTTPAPKLTYRQFAWDSAVLFVSVLWLGCSLLMDTIVMPLLYTSGMMTQPGFASAAHDLFGLFNRVEMLWAGLILTAILAMRQAYPRKAIEVCGSRSRWAILISAGLLTIAIVFTYILSPYMSGLGLSLELPGTAQVIPESMNAMHALYWSVEAIKLTLLAKMLGLCYSDIAAQFQES